MKSLDRLANVDRWRTGLLALLVALLIAHSLAPDKVTLDRSSWLLIIVVALLALAPTLRSARLPGGTEFQFRQKIEAARHLETDVRARLYREGFSGRTAEWPSLIEIPDEVRQLALERPADALARIRRALVQGLRLAARGVARDRMPPESTEELIDFIARYPTVWPEQIALIRVIWDVSNSSLLSGTVESSDALRMIAVAETLNDSFALGYSLNFEPNPHWEDAGLICEYEHCIENMPLPGTTRESYLSWRQRIQEALDRGFYDDHPSRKQEFEEMLASPVPNLPIDVDTRGACPVFGHYCPGGEARVSTCDAAREWIEATTG